MSESFFFNFNVKLKKLAIFTVSAVFFWEQ